MPPKYLKYSTFCGCFDLSTYWGWQPWYSH
jgi:hypothetical protein